MKQLFKQLTTELRSAKRGILNDEYIQNLGLFEELDKSKTNYRYGVEDEFFYNKFFTAKEQINNLFQIEQAKKQSKESKTDIKKGDILVETLSYEETTHVFYEVIAILPRKQYLVAKLNKVMEQDTITSYKVNVSKQYDLTEKPQKLNSKLCLNGYFRLSKYEPNKDYTDTIY